MTDIYNKDKELKGEELDDSMLEYVYGGIDIPDEILMELELANEKETASLRMLNFSSVVGAAQNVAEAFGGKK